MQKPEEGSGFLGVGVTGTCEHMMGTGNIVPAWPGIYCVDQTGHWEHKWG